MNTNENKERIEKLISEYETEIQIFKDKLSEIPIEAREHYENTIQKLELKKEEMKMKLLQFEDGADESTHTLAESFSEAWDKLKAGAKDAYEQLRSHLN